MQYVVYQVLHRDRGYRAHLFVPSTYVADMFIVHIEVTAIEYR
jgi:hypothetical protein